MKKRIKKIIDAIVYFFNFRKPVLLEFNCIDLVAGNKVLLLLAWNIKNAKRIKINPGRHVCRQATGAAIITLLPGTGSVDIMIRNCWRGTSLCVGLKHISLDKESLKSLTSDLQVFTRIEIAAIEPDGLPAIPQLRFKIPEIKKISCQTMITPDFNYQNFTYHEP